MASRRELNAADETAYSVGSETGQHVDLAWRYLPATDLASLPPTTVIKRSLTVRSVVLTSSSFVLRSQRAIGRPDLQEIIEIGKGLQGAVFEQVQMTIAPFRSEVLTIFSVQGWKVIGHEKRAW